MGFLPPSPRRTSPKMEKLGSGAFRTQRKEGRRDVISMRCQAKEERVAIPSPIMLIRPPPLHFLPCVLPPSASKRPYPGEEWNQEREVGFDKRREVFRNKIAPHSWIFISQESERVNSKTIVESLALFRRIFHFLSSPGQSRGEGWVDCSFVLGQERGQGWMGEVEEGEEEACLPLRLCSPCLPSSVYVCELLLLLLPRRLEPVWAKRGGGRVLEKSFLGDIVTTPGEEEGGGHRFPHKGPLCHDDEDSGDTLRVTQCILRSTTTSHSLPHL